MPVKERTLDELRTPDALVGRVLATISRYSMFAEGQRVGVAVSGGADSVALLHLLSELAPRFGMSLHVFHLNHCLRGEQSDADEHYVRGMAEALGVPVLAEKADVAARGGNLEQAARDARREFFHSAMGRLGLDRVALGHTMNDQAETVLLRLLRGSGTAGLAGILPVTAEGFVRPLLEVERCELEEWLASRGVGWRQDHTNLDPRFARNRLRLHFLPRLVRDFNPNLVETLARTADIAREEEEYWKRETATSGLLEQLPKVVRIDLNRFRQAHPALQRRLLREAIGHCKGDLRRIGFYHILKIMDLAAGSRGYGRLRQPGLDIRRSFHWLRISTPQTGHAPYSVATAVPGSVRVPALGIRLHFQVVDSQCHDEVPAIKPPESGYNKAGSDLDWDLISGPLVVGSWNPGDAYQPVGDSSPRSVKDLFQQARVPSWDRLQWPMIRLGDSILWVRQFGPAAGFAAQPGSKRVLRIWETAEI